MTEPDDDALRARLARLDPVASSAVPPLVLPRRGRRPGPAVVAAAAVLAVLVGAVTAVVASDGDGPSTPDVLAAESPTPEPSSSPSLVPSTAAPSPSGSTMAALEPSLSPTALATSTPRETVPAPTATAEPLTAEEVLAVDVRVTPGRAAPGNQVRVSVTVTNTSGRPLTLLTSDSCGNAFGNVSAAGSGLTFGGGGDVCGRLVGGEDLPPGASSQQVAFAVVAEPSTPGTFDVVATARFSDRPVGLGQAFTSQGRATVTLFDTTDGTRTFTLVNDTAEALSVECPGCYPGGMLGYPQVQPGGRLTVTSSVFNDVEARPGQVTLTPTRASSLEAYALRTCLDISSLDKGTPGTVVVASSATPCPVRPRS